MEKVALIVEDELFIVLELEEILHNAGYQVSQTYPTVREALAWLDGHAADFAIVDYRLRDATSEALVAKLVATKTPTVIYSGNDVADEIGEASMEHFEWVPKPSSAEAIAAAIARATSRVVSG